MKIIAADDEELALRALVSSIREAAPDAEIYAFRTAAEAIWFLKSTPCQAAFLDVEMPEINGVELAKIMKVICPKINVIFATGYGHYREAAFALHASGYLTKPILPEDVERELSDLRHPVPPAGKSRVRIQAFGNFEVFLDGMPMHFKYERTRELLAYLVDRTGAFCTNGELLGILFENESGHEAYLKKLKQDLQNSFQAAGCAGVILHQRGKMAVDPAEVDCDYYDWRNNRGQAINLYCGEYMAQYSWAEFKYGTLQLI